MKSLAAGLGFALVSAVSAAQAAVIEEFQTADWSGAAYSDDATGALQQCSVFAKYQHGTTIMFSLYAGGNWAVTLMNEEWKLNPQQVYPVQVRVDRRGSHDASATSLDASRLVFYTQAKEKLIDQVARGNRLTIGVQGKDYAFELSNSRKALASAEDCFERHSGPTVAAKAPAGGAAPSEAAKAGEGSGGATTLGERQTFGPWVVTATADDAGKFANCTAFGLFPKDEQLILSYFPDQTWEVGVYRPTWSLKPDGDYSLAYSLDEPANGPAAIRRAVNAPEAQRINFPVSKLETLMDKLGQGRELHLSLSGPGADPADLIYPLDRVEEALAAAKACTEKNTAVETPVAAAGKQDQSVEAAAETESSGSTETASSGAQAAPPPPTETPADAADPAILETFQEGTWAGFAYKDDAGGFSHCTVAVENPQGSAVLIAITKDGSRVFSQLNPGWTLSPGQDYDVSYGITSKTNQVSAQAFKGTARSATQWTAALPANDPLFDRLSDGVALAIFFQDKDYLFDVPGADKALSRLQDCVAKHGAMPVAGTAVPSAPASEAAETAAASPPPPLASGAEPDSAAEPPAEELAAGAAAAQSAPASEPASEAPQEGAGSDVPGGEPPRPSAEVAGGATLPPIGEKQIESAEVPGWTVGAYADAATDSFTHCSILAEYENGTTFAIARSVEGPLMMGLLRSDWTLPEAEEIPVKYRTDDGPWVDTRGKRVFPQIVGVNLGKEGDIASRVRGAKELVVELQNRTLTFDISDVPPAMDALEACVERHRPAAAPAVSSGKKKRKATEAPGPAAQSGSPAPQPVEPAPAEPSAQTAPATQSLLPSGEMDINTTRGITTPYTLIYPKDVLRESGGAGTAITRISHASEAFQCDVIVNLAAEGYSVPGALQSFDKAKVETERKKEFSQFSVLDHGEESFQSGPALFYTADVTPTAPGSEPFHLVHTEAAEGGRLYQLECLMSRKIVDRALPLAIFLIRNFSTNAEGKCCVDPTQ